MVGWEKFTLRTGRQVQSTGKSRCAAADNETDALCVCYLASTNRDVSFTLPRDGLVESNIICLAYCRDIFLIFLRTKDLLGCFLSQSSVCQRRPAEQDGQLGAMRAAAESNQCWADYRSVSSMDMFSQNKITGTNVFHWGACGGQCLFPHVKANLGIHVPAALSPR